MIERFSRNEHKIRTHETGWNISSSCLFLLYLATLIYAIFPPRGLKTFLRIVRKKLCSHERVCVRGTELELIKVGRFLFSPCTDVCIYVKRKPYIFHVSIFGKTRSYPWPT